MRFKVIYANKKIKINCLNGMQINCLPKDLNQHVSFVFPPNILADLTPLLNNLITDEMHNEMKILYDEQRVIIKKQQKLMLTIRKKLNPKIFETCEKFKIEHAEYFI